MAIIATLCIKWGTVSNAIYVVSGDKPAIGPRKSKYIEINANVSKNHANVNGKNNFHPMLINWS